MLRSRLRKSASIPLAGAMALAILCGSAGAQDANTDESLPPAYEEQMLELSEILGSLHYLRELCKSGEGGLWRAQMEELIAREEPSANRKAFLVSRFNRGFRGLSEVYRECTPAAAEAANRYLRRGMRIAAEIPSRFGQ
jgi:uncharacterized protein (TIGR02301 family)